MKTKPSVWLTPDAKSEKPLAAHGVGRERRRLILDEGLPYGHRYAELPSIATELERSQRQQLDVFAAHHGARVTVDLPHMLRFATQLAAQPTFAAMIKAAAERLSVALSQSVRGNTDERLGRLEHLVDARLSNLEERVSRLEALATPQVSEPENGDPFEAFRELRREIGEEKFRWIVGDD